MPAEAQRRDSQLWWLRGAWRKKTERAGAGGRQPLEQSR